MSSRSLPLCSFTSKVAKSCFFYLLTDFLVNCSLTEFNEFELSLERQVQVWTTDSKLEIIKRDLNRWEFKIIKFCPRCAKSLDLLMIDMRKISNSSSFGKLFFPSKMPEGSVNKRRKGNTKKENKMTRRIIIEYICLIFKKFITC